MFGIIETGEQVSMVKFLQIPLTFTLIPQWSSLSGSILLICVICWISSGAFSSSPCVPSRSFTLFPFCVFGVAAAYSCEASYFVENVTIQFLLSISVLVSNLLVLTTRSGSTFVPFPRSWCFWLFGILVFSVFEFFVLVLAFFFFLYDYCGYH